MKHCAKGVEDVFLTRLAAIAVGKEAAFVKGEDDTKQINLLAAFPGKINRS